MIRVESDRPLSVRQPSSPQLTHSLSLFLTPTHMCTYTQARMVAVSAAAAAAAAAATVSVSVSPLLRRSSSTHTVPYYIQHTGSCSSEQLTHGRRTPDARGGEGERERERGRRGCRGGTGCRRSPSTDSGKRAGSNVNLLPLEISPLWKVGYVANNWS